MLLSGILGVNFKVVGVYGFIKNRSSRFSKELTRDLDNLDAMLLEM